MTPDRHLPPPGVEYQSSWPVWDAAAQLWGYELIGHRDCWHGLSTYAERSMAIRAGRKMLDWTINRAATHAAQVA